MQTKISRAITIEIMVLIISALVTLPLAFDGLSLLMIVVFDTAKGIPDVSIVTNTINMDTTIEYMPNISVVRVRDKNILNTNPNIRVITEKIVSIATALKSLIISPLFFICLLKKTTKLDKIIKLFKKFILLSYILLNGVRYVNRIQLR